jgi:hypothetical protein
MNSKLFPELEGNLKQAVKFAKGESEPKAVFARTFYLSLDTIKGREQGKRKSDAAATNFLCIINADPEYVKKAPPMHRPYRSACFPSLSRADNFGHPSESPGG